MACAPGGTIHPSVGVFDLLDPASTLYFAQFVLWLQTYLSTIRECDNLQTRSFCWRLDHVGYDHSIQSSSNPSWIQSWIRAGISECVPEPSSITNFHTQHFFLSDLVHLVSRINYRLTLCRRKRGALVLTATLRVPGSSYKFPHPDRVEGGLSHGVVRVQFRPSSDELAVQILYRATRVRMAIRNPNRKLCHH